MDFTNNRILLFSIGTMTIALAVILSIKNYSPFPVPPNIEPAAISEPPKAPPPKALLEASAADADFTDQQLQQDLAIQGSASVRYAQKAACRMNVSIVNNAVERWYLTHNEQWPKDDLSDISRDIDFFPRGIPRCPVDNSRYLLDPESHRIIGHTHPEIPDPEFLRNLKVSSN